MRQKLTAAQVDVLTAYRDNTFHTRSPKVTDDLKSLGYLTPSFDEANKRWSLVISRSGLLVLEAHQGKVMSQR